MFIFLKISEQKKMKLIFSPQLMPLFQGTFFQQKGFLLPRQQQRQVPLAKNSPKPYRDTRTDGATNNTKQALVGAVECVTFTLVGLVKKRYFSEI